MNPPKIVLATFTLQEMSNFYNVRRLSLTRARRRWEAEEMQSTNGNLVLVLVMGHAEYQYQWYSACPITNTNGTLHVPLPILYSFYS